MTVIFKKFDEFEYIWFCSKILTVKNILKNNHNRSLFYNYIARSTFTGLQEKYYELLNFTTDEGCKENYRQCGVLDTLGNKYCIEELYSCPINKLKIDLNSKVIKYLDQGYKIGNLKNLSFIYNLYYSNNFINGTVFNILIKSEKKPQYINYNNFILDIDEMQRFFKYLKFNRKNNTKRRMQLSEIIEFTSQISELVDNSIDIIESSIKLDEAINRNKYIENEIKKFAKYIDRIYERINDTKNDDIYFESIGKNYYIKNYIGFQNNGEFDKFYKINFNLYKKYFPNEVCLLLSITGLVLFGIIIIISLINIKYMYDRTYKILVYCCQFFSSIFLFCIFLVF
jgi:hypothetical protein